jgi:hypothetical protein
MRYLLAVAAVFFGLTSAPAAPAATIHATPATLATALKSAADGDVLNLAAGAYGDLIVSRVFTDPLVIRASDPTRPPVFNKVALNSAKGVTLDGVVIRYEPTASTRAHTPVLAIDNSERIAVLNSDISAGPSINGVAEAAEKQDATGNVLGWPVGRAAQVMSSTDVRLEGNRFHHTDRGIILNKSLRVRILQNEVDSLRRSAIAGNASELDIVGNYFHGSKPWRWGDTPAGDHAEFMLLFPAPGERMSRVRIAENITTNDTGVDILGLNGGSVDGLVYEDNVVTGTDHQAIMWTDAPGAIIRRNVAIGRGQIILRTGMTGAQVIDNLAAGVWFSPSGLTTEQHAALKASVNLSGTRVLQYAAPGKPGYLSPAALVDLVAKAAKRTPQETYAATARASGYAQSPASADLRDGRIGELEATIIELRTEVAALTDGIAVRDTRVRTLLAERGEAWKGARQLMELLGGAAAQVDGAPTKP